MHGWPHIVENFRAIAGRIRGIRLPFFPRATPDLLDLEIAGNDELAEFLRTGSEFIPADDHIRNLASIRAAQSGQVNRGTPAVSQVTPGLDVFEGDTIIVGFPETEDAGTASFEPDDLLAEDPGTAEAAEPLEEEEEMPIHARAIRAAGRWAWPIVSGAVTGGAFAGGAAAVDELIGTGEGGTATAPPEPATTPGLGGFEGNGFNGNGARGPSIAQIRGQILRTIGARHGRRSFSYNTARRILRDLGEEVGARCLGITFAQACFLLAHPPKRRGRQITPKQIRRAMSAYNRVRALNKSVRKTLGPGCKL